MSVTKTNNSVVQPRENAEGDQATQGKPTLSIKDEFSIGMSNAGCDMLPSSILFTGVSGGLALLAYAVNEPKLLGITNAMLFAGIGASAASLVDSLVIPSSVQEISTAEAKLKRNEVVMRPAIQASGKFAAVAMPIIAGGVFGAHFYQENAANTQHTLGYKQTAQVAKAQSDRVSDIQAKIEYIKKNGFVVPNPD